MISTGRRTPAIAIAAALTRRFLTTISSHSQHHPLRHGCRPVPGDMAPGLDDEKANYQHASGPAQHARLVSASVCGPEARVHSGQRQSLDHRRASRTLRGQIMEEYRRQDDECRCEIRVVRIAVRAGHGAAQRRGRGGHGCDAYVVQIDEVRVGFGEEVEYDAECS